MRFRGLLTALVAAAALVCGIPAAADVGSGTGPPTAIGTGGAAASVEKLATEAAVGILRRGGNAVDAAVASAAVLQESPSRSRAESAAGASWSSAPPAARSRRSTDERWRRWRCTRRRCGRTALLALQRRALQRSLGRCARHVETWADALENYGTMSLAEVFAPAIRRASRIRHRPGVVRPGEREPRLVRRHPGERGVVPRSGRNSSRRRDRVHEPRARKDVRAHRISARRVLPRSGRRRTGRDRSAPGRQPVGEPCLAFWRDEDARPAHVRRAGAGSDPRQLPGARRLLDGAAVERRLDRRGGAEHPRGLQPRVDDEGPPCTTTSRPRATPSRTARTSPIRPTSTCLSPGCSRTSTRRPGAR